MVLYRSFRFGLSVIKLVQHQYILAEKKQVAVISVLALLLSVVTIGRALILGMLPNWQLKDRSVLEHLGAVDWVATGQAIALGP
ncbi:MAG: hypothetical protein ACJ8AG_23725 [Ktedonobacteraceae bacterium]|jgi:hypothetical protein